MLRIIMKKIFLILLSFLLILSSCSTTERAYSFVSRDGIRVFLRPVKLKGEIPVVMDMTIPTEKSKIIGDATQLFSPRSERYYQGCRFSFSILLNRQRFI